MTWQIVSFTKATVVQVVIRLLTNHIFMIVRVVLVSYMVYLESVNCKFEYQWEISIKIGVPREK